ncbi:MAG: toprim domain-containing protein [Candidatus Aenigmatarchaeota archaeon]
MENLQKIFDKLDCPVIVEGKSDVAVMEDFQMDEIVSLNGRPLYRVASSVSRTADEALVLTDFDSEGEKIAKKLNVFLERFGVVPKNSIRGKIKEIVTKEGVSQIENIKS